MPGVIRLPAIRESSLSNEIADPFQSLVQNLSNTLGPSSGLNSSDIDPKDLQKMMQAYVSNEKEWEKYAWPDPSRSYTRNLVDRGNGKSNLLILVWTPGKGSPVHDHANAHCVMKVLQGCLQETQYDWPKGEIRETQKETPLNVKKETIFKENQVTYMSDNLGLHKVSNPDPENYAVSLHLYTPPNAAKNGCHIFDESSGKACHVKQCHFFSEYGQVM